MIETHLRWFDAVRRLSEYQVMKKVDKMKDSLITQGGRDWIK